MAGSLLVLDHITSNTIMHLPIAWIAKYAKEEYDMFVMVDRAHGLFSLPLYMGTTWSTGRAEGGNSGHVNIYLTSVQKWFSSPCSVALLFCANPDVRDTVLARPAVIS